MATADQTYATIGDVVTKAMNDLREAFRALGPQIQRLAEAFRDLSKSVERLDAEALLARRVIYGGNATDAHRWPDEWQSLQCATWLPDCPSDEHDLRCTGSRHKAGA